jgi:hypothetical protein
VDPKLRPMVVDDSAHTGLLDDSALRRLIKGTLMATLLLAAQEGGKPMNEAAWVLVGAIVTTAVDAYATHFPVTATIDSGAISLASREASSTSRRAFSPPCRPSCFSCWQQYFVGTTITEIRMAA